MSRTANLDRALVAAICASTALWLTACGGSSGTQTSASHTSSAATSATRTTTSTSSTNTARLHAAQVKAIALYVECLRASGQHVPPPNTSGKGPVFNSNGVDTSTAAFKAASVKCLAKAETFFHAHPH